MSLTDDEIARIRLEEEVRLEIRRDLEQTGPRPSRADRLWRFANSSFGLFVFSTVVLGLLSWSFTRWDEARRANERSAALVRELDVEIAHRLEYFRNVDVDSLGVEALYDFDSVFSGTEEEWLPRPIFPQYKDRTFASLLWELHTLLPDEDASAVKSASDAAIDLGTTLKRATTITLEIEDDVANDWILDRATVATVNNSLDVVFAVQRWQ